jgi:hypothetical protein
MKCMHSDVLGAEDCLACTVEVIAKLFERIAAPRIFVTQTMAYPNAGKVFELNPTPPGKPN